jgi:hypothetical protein
VLKSRNYEVMANSNPINGQGGPGHTAGTPFTTTNSPSRQRWKWELAIRFQLKNPNAKQSEVAAHIGIDVVTLSQWQKQQEWVDLHNQIVTGILSSIDAELVEDITHQRLTLKRLVPVAIQNLADLALQSANPSIKLKASMEILDRDGNMAKVQRVGLATVEQGGVASHVDNEVAKLLTEALVQAQATKEKANSSKTATPSIEDAPITKELQ